MFISNRRLHLYSRLRQKRVGFPQKKSHFYTFHIMIMVAIVLQVNWWMSYLDYDFCPREAL